MFLTRNIFKRYVQFDIYLTKRSIAIVKKSKGAAQGLLRGVKADKRISDESSLQSTLKERHMIKDPSILDIAKKSVEYSDLIDKMFLEIWDGFEAHEPELAAFVCNRIGSKELALIIMTNKSNNEPSLLEILADDGPTTFIAMLSLKLNDCTFPPL